MHSHSISSISCSLYYFISEYVNIDECQLQSMKVNKQAIQEKLTQLTAKDFALLNETQ